MSLIENLNNIINNETNSYQDVEHTTTDQNNLITNAYTAHNFLIAAVISTIYILLISKFAELISFTNESDTDHTKSIGTYVMIIYFLSIIGIVFSYLFFKENSVPDFIMKWSMNLSGILLLIYTVINYWDYLDDYSKCTLLISTFVSIVYYLYKIY
jgi:hypothetical protein